MPRQPRDDWAGQIYHALNRGNPRQAIFHKGGDYQAFVRVLDEGLQEYPVKLFSFTLMPSGFVSAAKGGDPPAVKCGSRRLSNGTAYSTQSVPRAVRASIPRPLLPQDDTALREFNPRPIFFVTMHGRWRVAAHFNRQVVMHSAVLASALRVISVSMVRLSKNALFNQLDRGEGFSAHHYL